MLFRQPMCCLIPKAPSLKPVLVPKVNWTFSGPKWVVAAVNAAGDDAGSAGYADSSAGTVSDKLISPLSFHKP